MTETEIERYEVTIESDDDQALWDSVQLRPLVIRGLVEMAKDRSCRLLIVRDRAGKQLHMEGFGPRLWDLVRDTHDRLDERVEELRTDIKDVHALVQQALQEFERGDQAKAQATLRAAMDREFDLFGECECSGREELLEAFGFAPNEDTTSCGKHGFCCLPTGHKGKCLDQLQIEKREQGDGTPHA